MVQTLSSHHHSSNDWECWKYECVDEHRLLVYRTTMPQRLMMGRVHWTLHGHPHDDRGLHHGPVVGCEIGIDHGHDHDHVNGIENESEIFLLISLTTTKRCQKKDEGWEPDEKERRQEWRRAQTRRHNTSTNNERGGTSTNTSTNTMTVVAIESEPQPPFR